MEDLAPDRHVEPALGAFRGFVVRDALHHGSLSRILSFAGREDSLGAAARALLEVAPSSSDRAGPGRRHPVFAPSILARRALSAGEGKGRSALVQSVSA